MGEPRNKLTKVVLYMEGGCIQAVSADGPVRVIVVDKDELVEAGVARDEREPFYKKVLKGCEPVDSWGYTLPTRRKGSRQ